MSKLPSKLVNGLIQIRLQLVEKESDFEACIEKSVVISVRKRS